MLFSADEPYYDEQKIRALREILIEQQEMITELSTIVNYLDDFREVCLDESEFQNYTEKTMEMYGNQKKHFDRIDQMINANLMAVKKEKTVDRTIVHFGKEVRKLEAGVRTLRLFTCDVIGMLAPNSTAINRVKDRISYFEKRAVSLEVEIKGLLNNLALL